MKTSRLFNIFLVVFVDLLGFGLIFPLLPYYAETFGASAFVIGLIVAAYAAASLVGAPMMGRLSDRYGRRPILILSIAGTFFGYVLFGFAHPVGTLLANLFHSSAVNSFTIGILFAGRIIDGFTGGNITVAQAYISDITDEKNRSRGLGVIGSAFGLGFIIGPAAGGLLSRWGYSVPAFAAAGVALVNLVSIYFFLPESLTPEQRVTAQNKPRAALTLKALLAALKRPKIGPLLMVRTMVMLGFAMFQSVFALFAQQRLKLSSQTTGFVLTYVGAYSVIIQGLVIGQLTRRFKENNILILSMVTMFLGMLGWAFTRSLPVMLLMILPLSGGGWILNLIITSAITRVVAPDEIGGMLGISTSLESITRVVSPTLGGFLISSVGLWAPGIFSASVILVGIWLAYRYILKEVLDEPRVVEEICCA